MIPVCREKLIWSHFISLPESHSSILARNSTIPGNKKMPSAGPFYGSLLKAIIIYLSLRLYLDVKVLRLLPLPLDGHLLQNFLKRQ